MATFYNFPPTSSNLHPLLVENCDSNSRLVVDEDDNGTLRLERDNHFCHGIIGSVGGGGGGSIANYYVANHPLNKTHIYKISVMLITPLNSIHNCNRFLFVLVAGYITVIGNEIRVKTSRFANIWSQIE